MFEVGQTVTLNSDSGPFEVILRARDYVETDSNGNPVEVYHNNTDSITCSMIEKGRIHGVGPEAESVLEWIAAKMGF